MVGEAGAGEEGWLPKGRDSQAEAQREWGVSGRGCLRRERFMQRLRGETEHESLGSWQQDLWSQRRPGT